MHSIAYIFGLLHFKIINDILNDVKCATVNGLMPRYMTSYTVCVRYHMSVLVLNCIIFFLSGTGLNSVFSDMTLV